MLPGDQSSGDGTDGGGGAGGGGASKGEAYSIQPRDIPFLQEEGHFNNKNSGISLTAKGEPKSGTTWLGRLIPQLALELCGSPLNAWCEMGGLKVMPNEPSPWYEFEMLKKDESGSGRSPTLFLHYKGGNKHIIPGMHMDHPPDGCTNGGKKHRNFFEDDPPCVSGGHPTRERLRGCLWDTADRCIQYSRGEFRRTAVVFRDPRNVVISEFYMRRDFYHKLPHAISLDDFILARFETIVSWTHQRWVWHTETLKENSFVAYYEELKGNHLGMIDLAAFMGLSCSEDEALRVWQSHQSASYHDFWVISDFGSSKYQGLDTVALTFTVLGTITWLLLATDGLGWFRVYACGNASSGIFRYWSLINSFVEDLPQLVITFMTTGFSTVAGALNIATAVFAFMGKVSEAYASRVDDLPGDFMAVSDPDTRPLVTAKLELEDEMRKKAANIQEALPMVAHANSTPGSHTAMKATYDVARKYRDWVNLIVAVKRLDKSLFAVADDDGTIPKGLSELEQLTHLSFRGCQRTGSIPRELGNLANLKGLYLDNNSLRGSIPVELGNQEKLKGLYLSQNLLTGAIPSELGRLSNLVRLRLDNNRLRGPIPPELGQLGQLTELHLGSNQLTGHIPAAFGDLRSISLLFLDRNQLSGPIPCELGRLRNLVHLSLDGNLLGVPVELAKLHNLTKLHLRNNQLTGALPTEIKDLPRLRQIFLEGNDVSGAGVEPADIRE
eukprot:g8789.t1